MIIFASAIFIVACQKAAPLDAHAQAVGVKHPEADALPDLSHSEESGESPPRLFVSVSSLCSTEAPPRPQPNPE